MSPLMGSIGSPPMYEYVCVSNEHHTEELRVCIGIFIWPVVS